MHLGLLEAQEEKQSVSKKVSVCRERAASPLPKLKCPLGADAQVTSVK